MQRLNQKPKHLTEHEWNEQKRRAQKQLEYDIYSQPAWVDNVALVAGTIVVLTIVGGICFILFKIFLAIGGLFS